MKEKKGLYGITRIMYTRKKRKTFVPFAFRVSFVRARALASIYCTLWILIPKSGSEKREREREKCPGARYCRALLASGPSRDLFRHYYTYLQYHIYIFLGMRPFGLLYPSLSLLSHCRFFFFFFFLYHGFEKKNLVFRPSCGIIMPRATFVRRFFLFFHFVYMAKCQH